MTQQPFIWRPDFWHEWLDDASPCRAYVVSYLTEKAVSLLDPRPEDHILNAGCGFGREAAFMLKRFQEIAIVAVDVSPEMVKTARDSLSSTGRFEVQQSPLEDLPFADNSFDKVLCLGVMMHVQEEEKALRELARVLKPGGRLVLTFNSALHPLAPLLITHFQFGKHSGYKQSLRMPGYYTSRLREVGLRMRLHPGSFNIGLGGNFALRIWKALDLLTPTFSWATYEPILVCEK